MPSPKVFISYSWSSKEHAQWVVNLAEELRANGVDAILDKWDLKEGHDSIKFMEQMVSDPDVKKVIMVCDDQYARKADGRDGGVGTEAQILSPELYKSAQQDKFVAVVTERNTDGQACVPTFYSSRIHIDMSDSELYSDNFDQLLRWIFNKPLFPKPALGSIPEFSNDNPDTVVGSVTVLNRAIRAVRNSEQNAVALAEDYFNSVLEDLPTVAVSSICEDEEIWASIKTLHTARNQVSELFGILARSIREDALGDVFVRFFERMARFHDIPDEVSSYKKYCRDNFKFFTKELFLVMSAKLIRYERFELLNQVLESQFFVPGRHNSAGQLLTFPELNRALDSFEVRKRRLNINRLYLEVDLMKERCEGGGLDFNEIIEADFILYLRSCADRLNKKNVSIWPARTLVLIPWDFITEKFVRARSARYFERMSTVLGVTSVEEFRFLIEAINTPKLPGPPSDYGRISVEAISNVDQLGTLP